MPEPQGLSGGLRGTPDKFVRRVSSIQNKHFVPHAGKRANKNFSVALFGLTEPYSWEVSRTSCPGAFRRPLS